MNDHQENINELSTIFNDSYIRLQDVTFSIIFGEPHVQWNSLTREQVNRIVRGVFWPPIMPNRKRDTTREVSYLPWLEVIG